MGEDAQLVILINGMDGFVPSAANAWQLLVAFVVVSGAATIAPEVAVQTTDGPVRGGVSALAC